MNRSDRNVDGLEFAINTDRQALMRELVDDIEHAVSPPVMGSVFKKIVRPDVIGPLWSQTDAGTVGKPQPPTLGLLVWDFQPLAAPDALDPGVTDEPAGLAQQCCYLAIAVAAILASQFNHICRQLLGIGTAPRRLALCRAVLSERHTGATLGHLQMNANMLDAGATTRGA